MRPPPLDPVASVQMHPQRRSLRRHGIVIIRPVWKVMHTIAIRIAHITDPIIGAVDVVIKGGGHLLQLIPVPHQLRDRIGDIGVVNVDTDTRRGVDHDAELDQGQVITAQHPIPHALRPQRIVDE